MVVFDPIISTKLKNTQRDAATQNYLKFEEVLRDGYGKDNNEFKLYS
jgi:hypothetical protein